MSTPSGSVWRPTPPQRGSFPLDHDAECSQVMKDYLECLKYARGQNAPGCRLAAKKYLKCRMDK
jgi:cytochrome c oxidase assembly protein subunit 19